MQETCGVLHAIARQLADTQQVSAAVLIPFSEHSGNFFCKIVAAGKDFIISTTLRPASRILDGMLVAGKTPPSSSLSLGPRQDLTAALAAVCVTCDMLC
jgi:hypothetical protein